MSSFGYKWHAECRGHEIEHEYEGIRHTVMLAAVLLINVMDGCMLCYQLSYQAVFSRCTCFLSRQTRMEWLLQ